MLKPAVKVDGQVYTPMGHKGSHLDALASYVYREKLNAFQREDWMHHALEWLSRNLKNIDHTEGFLSTEHGFIEREKMKDYYPDITHSSDI